MVLWLVPRFLLWGALAAASTLLIGACAGGPHKADPPKPPPSFFYYRDAAKPDSLLRVDWEGNRVGSLPVRGGFTPSPDGSRLLLPGGQVLTAEGRTLPAVPGGSVWADDSRHLCAILDASGSPANQPLPGQAVNGLPPLNRAYPPAFLYVLAPGESLRKVATAPSYGRLVPYVAACSIRFDTGVITISGGPVRSAVVQVTRLSDGTQLLRTSSFGETRAVSSDGQLVAVDDRAGSSTVIRHVPDGEVLARLPYADVIGFSADGTRLVITDYPQVMNSSTVARAIRVTEWRTGQEIWSMVGYGGRVEARPNTPDVAVHVCVDARCSAQDVWLVGDHSTPRRIAANASPWKYASGW